MGSGEITQKRQSCHRCRKSRRRCDPSEVDPRTCTNCHEAQLDCSLPGSRITPSRDAKRKVEEIGDTPERESVRPNRATSSATAPYIPQDVSVILAQKKPRYGKRSRPLPDLPAENKQSISANACGICLEEHRDSGEKKGDLEMLLCDVASCQRWYHLSCLLFNRKVRQVFYSFHTGTKKVTLICPSCCNTEQQGVFNAVEQAKAEFEKAMERVNQVVTAENAEWPETMIPSPPLEQNTSHTFKQSVESMERDESKPTYFETAREEKFQGFRTDTIKSLLSNIEEAVDDYDREVCNAKALFHNGNDISMDQPLRVWDQIDPGQHHVFGKEWFEVDGETNNSFESHAPITAALRRILGATNDKPLHISHDLHDLSFSHVHTALINWFVFDILNNELNLYLFPNMRPLRAVMTAVANFGDARWKGCGRQVLREVQLRAWNKKQFRQEVVENVSWQGELIRRLDHFLRPLTKKFGKIDPWSPTRASIIKHTIELWTYLEASVGWLDIIQPKIGGHFDGKTCENFDENRQPGRPQDIEIKWVTRRGFWFKEDSSDGSVRPLVKKALVVVR